VWGIVKAEELANLCPEPSTTWSRSADDGLCRIEARGVHLGPVECDEADAGHPGLRT